FGAKEVIFTSFAGLEPHRGVAAGHHILLDPEGWNKKAVNYILRGHGQLDRLADRNVEFVDLTLTIRVLDFPHPLFTDHRQVEGVGRWGVDFEIDLGRPDKDG